MRAAFLSILLALSALQLGAAHPADGRYIATAYALRGRTASGHKAGPGIVAADPRHLPLGSQISVVFLSGRRASYTVRDTGGQIKGKRIDIWMQSNKEAQRFGRQRVQVTVQYQ